jgi:PAS domain S-box-containing protein
LTPGIIDDDSFAEIEKQADRRARRTMFGAFAVLAAFAAICIWLTIGFAADERGRILQQWQARLGIVADSRADNVAHWLDQQYATLRGLAQNASLQVYVGGLTAAAGAKNTEAVEGGYLRNLLTVVAERDGFIGSRPRTPINANVSIVGTAGLVILDETGRPLVGTSGMPALPAGFQLARAMAIAGRPGLVDIQLGADGLPVIGFVVPIYSIQGDPGVTPAIGFIAGLKEVGAELFGRPAHSGEISTTAETYLIRRDGDNVLYLSPLADGLEPLRLSLALATPDLADAFALAHPGEFQQMRDYRGRDVLFTSRAIAGSPWILVRKIDRGEALNDSEQHLTVILTVLICGIGAAVALALALWLKGTSVRLAKANSRNTAIMKRLQRSAAFLQLVSDAQPTAISTVDREGRYSFANRKAADEVGATPDALIGKTIGDVLGPFKGKLYGDINQGVLQRREPIAQTRKFDGTPPRIVRSEHIPLSDGGDATGVLMIEQDVTDLFRERDRAAKTLEDLVTTLVGLLDSRVPFSSNHSARVAKLSKWIAIEMNATADEIRTAEVTGNLINLGKLLLPHAILTKTGSLDDAEREVVRQSLLDTAKMLEGVDFEIPVALALSQTQERWDGEGYPDGLAGDAICLPARVVALANSFVSLTSPRSFRDAMSFEAACDILLKDADKQYDRRTVAALMNYLFNRNGAEQLGSSTPVAARQNDRNP